MLVFRLLGSLRPTNNTDKRDIWREGTELQSRPKRPFFERKFRLRRLPMAAAMKRGGIMQEKLKQLVYLSLQQLGYPHIHFW